MRIHRVYCKSVSESDKKFSLDEAESHHLVKALRLKEGSHVEVFDGNGKQALCLIVEHSNKKCELERISEIEDQSIPSRSLTAVIPFIKKNNFNYMIQKLTEIGVNKFMIYKPDLSDQSIAKKDLEKIILCDVQKEIYPDLETSFLNLLHNSGYPEIKFDKKIDFEKLYNQKSN